MCMEMFDAASVETRVVNDLYPFFLQFQFANQFCVTFSGILQPKSPATPNETNVASKTIYVRNLSYTVERSDMYVYIV